MMFWFIVGVVTCIKLLLIPAYHSTDFEVHRNWLAITHTLPIEQWYREDTSEWTLDYPPLFAWFEYFLSLLARFFDVNMLQVENLNYASPNTIIFQRLSVIVTDLVFAYGIKEVMCMFPIDVNKVKEGVLGYSMSGTGFSGCCTYLSTSGVRKSSKWASKWRSPATVLQILLFGNIGLIMVDHIHFQYNGFLFGVMLLSISKLFQAKCIQSAIFFAILLNLKHIFIYVSPAYVVYLLRNYCFHRAGPGLFINMHAFSKERFFRLSLAVLSVFLVSFGPFIATNQVELVLRRLFPFKRGLCHAYWAPNIWAIYNTVDKILAYVLRMAGFQYYTNTTMTSGVIQDIEHAVLPNILPETTFLLTLVAIAPCLIKLWRWPGNPLNFIRCLVLCALSSFLFGWHVHEKAILIAIIPLSLIAVIWQKEAQIFVMLSVTGYFSLHPLLYESFESPIKILLLIIHCTYCFSNLSYLFDEQKGSLRLPLLSEFETIYIAGLFTLFVFDIIVSPYLGITFRFPFLNLLLTSLYCSIGITYSWMKYYWYFMTMSETNHKRKTH